MGPVRLTHGRWSTFTTSAIRLLRIMHILFTRLAPAMALSLPLLALAQQSAPAPSKASAPALPYRSAFADYKPLQDLKPGNWRQLNDTLTLGTALGGHGGHAGHSATKPAPQAPAKPAPAASKPAASDEHHQGHRAQGAQQ
jgi:hypothetical protein